MKLASLCLALAISLSIPGEASAAPDTVHFGDPGTLSPFGYLSLDYGNLQPPGGKGAHSFAAELSPGLMYFVARNLAVGGSLIMQAYTLGNGDARFTSFGGGVAPEVGYNFVLSKTLGIFPRLRFVYIYSRSKAGPSNESIIRRSRALVGLYAPLLVHFSQFFLGVGPYVRLDLLSNLRAGRVDSVGADKLSEVGVQTTIGGWL